MIRECEDCGIDTESKNKPKCLECWKKAMNEARQKAEEEREYLSGSDEQLKLPIAKPLTLEFGFQCSCGFIANLTSENVINHVRSHDK